jgi:Ca2+-binding RTX toxin-like protein
MPIRPSTRHPFATTRRRRLVAGLVMSSAAACSSGHTPGGAGGSGPGAEPLATVSQALLATPCTYDASGNVTLKVMDGEVVYVGLRPGCTLSPVAGGDQCVILNATDSQQSACKVASAGRSITINGQGAVKTDAGTTTPAEKVILDYTNGLFALATATATLVNVTLDTTAATGGAPAVLSSVEILSPAGGGNMAIGATGLDVNTLASRPGGAKADVKLKWSASTAGGVAFHGGAGGDAFTGDAAGWTAPPAGWDTAVNVSKAVGTVYMGPITASGGAGNDVLAGGAGPNVLLGGPGDDTFLQGVNAHAETIQGGDGLDTVDYGVRTAALSITLDTVANDGAAGEADDVGQDVEILKGGAGNDRLDAHWITVTDVVLIGNAGDDVLTGGQGVDDLCGGPGNDKLSWSGAGGVTEAFTGDLLSGGPGTDTADYSGAWSGVQVCLSATDPTCFPPPTDAGPATQWNGVVGQVDVINASSPAAMCPRASLTIGVAAGGTTLYAVPAGELGTAIANDVEDLTGQANENNVLHCGSVACTLVGGAGDDVLVGSPGLDEIHGGGAAGGDTVSTAGGNDLVYLNHAGTDGLVDTINCAGAVVTILLSAVDGPPNLTNCASATVVQ